MDYPFLLGDRLYLRPLDVEDMERCLRWINDPEISRNLGHRFPVGRAGERAWLEGHYKDQREVPLAIVLKDGDRHIGNCGLHEIDLANRKAVFGLLIGERDAWGHGYGPEAARLLLGYGFADLGLHRVSLQVFAFNEPAQRVYEKVGFVREGCFRDAYYRGGAFHDAIIMALLDEEWEELPR